MMTIIASPDVESEIIWRYVSDTIRKNQTMTIHIVHPGQTEYIVAGMQEERRPGETEKEEEEDE